MQLKFQAALAPTSTAVKIDGVDGAARITLDLPANEEHAILALTRLTGKILNITIDVDYDSEIPEPEIEGYKPIAKSYKKALQDK